MVLLVTLAALMVLAAAGISRRIVLSGFEQVERERVRAEVQHAQKLVGRGAQDLADRFEDWSSWDDPYEFVEDGNARFVESNLTKEMLASARIDAIAFINASGKVVYAIEHDRQAGANHPMPDELRDRLVDLAGDASDAKDVVRDLIATPTGLMMVISNPLLRSSRSGPCRGKLVIGRYLGERELGRLAELARIGLVVRAVGAEMPAEFREAAAALASGEQVYVRETSGHQLFGYGELRDLRGHPVALVRVELPREVLHQGHSSTFSSTVAIVLTATPFVLIALVLLSRLERARAETSQREKYYRTLIEGGSDLIIILDAAHRVRYHSPAVAHSLGRDEGELEDGELKTWVKAEDHAALEAMLARVEADAKAEVRGTFRCLRRDGSLSVIEAIFKNMTLDESVSGVLMNGRDVTERERIEAERRRLEEELRQAQKLEAVGRLAGGIAHDFNNLLTVILGHADLLARGNLTAAAAEGVTALRAAARRAAALTQQLLSFSRRQVIAPKVADINRSVVRAKDMLARLIGEDIRLEVKLGSDIWPVRVDPNQFDQVLLNLAVNARDAMPDGGQLLIETSTDRVGDDRSAKTRGLPPGDYTVVSVSDTGAGIPEEDLPHIFEPFYTTKPLGQGTGLGLATVYGLVRQHGGGVRVESSPGHGATFRIYLPRSEASLATPLPSERPAAVRGAGGDVLLVEDDAAVRDLAGRILVQAGFRVSEAAGPDVAIAWAREPGHEFDVLVTDVIMPTMNGRELATALRAVVPELRVLYVSGYTDTILRKLPELERNEDFLQKPFSGDALVEKVNALLARRA